MCSGGLRPPHPLFKGAKVLKAGKVLKVSRVLKLAKLTRLLKLNVWLDRFEDEFQLSITKMKLVSLLAATFVIAHFNACFWAYISRLDDSLFSMSWQMAYKDRMTLESTVSSEYLAALYWSITTMTTVGYGDL